MSLFCAGVCDAFLHLWANGRSTHMDLRESVLCKTRIQDTTVWMNEWMNITFILCMEGAFLAFESLLPSDQAIIVYG